MENWVLETKPKYPSGAAKKDVCTLLESIPIIADPITATALSACLYMGVFFREFIVVDSIRFPQFHSREEDFTRIV